ncbi:BatA domain-containing protein [Pseudoxanthomonas wuyuanensis]
MNLALLLPAALAALAALALPLLIHLARRSEQRPTDFAALRWLRQKPKPRHRIRFDEWPLLLLRLLLLALLALWLAQPVLYGSADRAHRVAVVPGGDAAALREAGLPADARWLWLAPGFPDFKDAPPPHAQPISSLLRQLDAELPADAALTVFVPAEIGGTDAQRPRLSRAVDWRVVAGTMPAQNPVPSPPLALSVRYSDQHASALRYLRAAAAAWRAPAAEPPPAAAPDSMVMPASTGISIAPAGQPIAAGARQLIWLAPGPLPAEIQRWIDGGGTALVDAQTTFAPVATMMPLWRGDDGAVLAEGAASGRGRLLRLTRALQPQAMPQLLEPDFPRRLRALFEPEPLPPGRVDAAAHAPLTGAAAYPQPPRDLQPWLALLIALLFAGERWLATRPRRAATP